MTTHAHAIVTQARAVEVEPCSCGTERLPTLRRMGSRSYLVRYVCLSCGRKGVNGVDAQRAARNWNADIHHHRRTAT